ncbi:MAG: hypothetical protein M1829_000461 [Trizodia sp. TS-e1964]|nr:MAG: hypothetical protein M1829_000461 [Trizodia sp. TS-e1964]
MESLLADSYKTIDNQPIGTELDYFRDRFQATIQSYNPTVKTAEESTTEQKDVVLKLLQSLLSLPAAFSLPSISPQHDNLAVEIFNLISRISNDGCVYKDYHDLLELVARKALDTEIWNAVYSVIKQVLPATSFVPQVLTAIAVVTSSASQQGSELKTIFCEKFYSMSSRNKLSETLMDFFTNILIKKSGPLHNGVEWTTFPNPPTEKAVWDWFDTFQSNLPIKTRGIYYRTSSTKELTGGESKRQLDIIVKLRDNSSVDSVPYNWEDICVIGEHKQSQTSLKDLLLQLGRYVREVFIAQPTRRFIHGFFIHGTSLELWVFDRSGPYSSGSFDIHKEPERFIHAIAGYLLMDDEDLGLDTYIKRNLDQMSISIKPIGKNKKKKLLLDRIPLSKQGAIVCRGTSCYKTINTKFVVKFSWAAPKHLSSELDLLEYANDKGVKGIPRVFAYPQITTIGDLRAGLTFDRPYNFKSASNIGSPPGSPPLPLTSYAHVSLASRILAGSPTKKDLPEAGSEESPLGRTRSKTQKEEIALKTSTHDIFIPKQREFGCLVLSPPGKPILQFESIKVLLKVLLDAITAHKSLLIEANILHRDVSENNIIQTDPQDNDGRLGMLIDLDLATKIGDTAVLKHLTGTMQFMGIGVLLGYEHTYRHDLESFFYVLLWISAHRSWEIGFECDSTQRPQNSILKKWYTGNFTDIAQAKRSHMHADGFEDILI